MYPNSFTVRILGGCTDMIDALLWKAFLVRREEEGVLSSAPLTLIFCLVLTASVHSDGVILRDDFDSSEALDYTVW